MKKTLLFAACALWLAGSSYAASDILMGDFEDGNSSFYKWTGDSLAVVDNPAPDAVNSSSKVLIYNANQQWGGVARWYGSGILSPDYVAIEADVWIPVNGGIQLYIDNSPTDGSSKFTQLKNVTGGSWQHVVFDISSLTLYDYRQIAFQNTVDTFLYLDNIKIVAKVVVPADTFEVSNKLDAPGITDDADYSVKGILTWDTDSIYLTLMVKDDTIVLEPGDPWMVDNIEIYFDMKNLKTPDCPRNNSAWPPIWQSNYGMYQFRVSPDKTWDELNSAYPNVKVNYRYEETADGYNFYINFDVKSLDSTVNLAVGDSIGFDILASDDDTNPAVRNQVLYHSPVTTIYRDAASWATIVLAENGKFVKVDDNIAPTAPANVTAEVVNTNRVKLTWDVATDNIVVQAYVIFNGNNPIDTVVADCSKATNSVTIRDLADGTYTFKVMAVDLYGNVSTMATSNSVTITTDAIAHISTGLSIFPNPVAEILNIRSNANIYQVTVYSITGQACRVFKLNSNEAQLDLSTLNAGIYFIKAQTANGSITQRIIKK
ncbi:MAG TPA: T9SS type A sorting domain-containing protein [Bacteroidales bacterium]|nr:T9SS type A sorting domain-containing protein [Bacteroidales bacterium]HPO65496.1 T9SS type A sorting domain-containing protein [Bacteroidales bacterium]